MNEYYDDLPDMSDIQVMREEEYRASHMSVTRTSSYSGIERTMELKMTAAQLAAYTAGGVMVQHAFPDLTPAEREFVKTGITAEEWDELFKEPEDE